MKASRKPSFQISGKKEMINYSEVILLKADVNYTFIYLKNGQVNIVAKTLKTLEPQFADFSFFRVHKSFMINLKYVKKQKGDLKSSIEMINHQFVSISRRKRVEFAKAIGWI
jgi:DNA-binding LytR/AlgR family response regulator